MYSVPNSVAEEDSGTNTIPSKNMNLPYSIRMFSMNFWQLTVHVQQNIFGITYKSWLVVYASFGTFCVQIGQFFETQGAFEKCSPTVKSLFLKENDVDSFENSNLTIFNHFSKNLCVMSPKIDQFGRKRCQKKMWATNFYTSFFVVYERSAVKNSFSTYVWSKVDSCFCEALYL